MFNFVYKYKHYKFEIIYRNVSSRVKIFASRDSPNYLAILARLSVGGPNHHCCGKHMGVLRPTFL